jgi:hypothetical protein
MVIFSVVVPSFLTRRTDKQIRKREERRRKKKKRNSFLDDFLRKQLANEKCTLSIVSKLNIHDVPIVVRD